MYITIALCFLRIVCNLCQFSSSRILFEDVSYERSAIARSEIIEEVIKDQNDSTSVLEHTITCKKSTLQTVKQENITALVQFIQTATDSDICSVKTTKRDVVIPSGETVKITCRANTRSSRGNKISVLFEPDPEQSWPTGLETPESLTSIGGGSSSRVNIQIKNVTDHKIVLPGRTALGHLQQVKSVTPMEVQKKPKKSP